ncbi:MAG: DUF2975 domain-containing protein [Clostridiales bacterium]|nr:DUF2975 domain-containing protein [Clostridiales bacterium]
MKGYSTKILRLVIFIAGAIVIAICGGTAWQAIKTNPSSEYYLISYILFIGICSAAIPCFIALYQSYKLLGYIDTDRAFSELSVKALKIITRAALIEFFICALGGLPFFYIVAKKEDAPGLLLVGAAIAGVAFVISVFASVLNRLLQNVIVLKSENDLTI